MGLDGPYQVSIAWLVVSLPYSFEDMRMEEVEQLEVGRHHVLQESASSSIGVLTIIIIYTRNILIALYQPSSNLTPDSWQYLLAPAFCAVRLRSTRKVELIRDVLGIKTIRPCHLHTLSLEAN